jgi:hypothetical protein
MSHNLFMICWDRVFSFIPSPANIEESFDDHCPNIIIDHVPEERRLFIFRAFVIDKNSSPNFVSAKQRFPWVPQDPPPFS